MTRVARCPRKFGRYGICGAMLTMTTLNGRLVVTCHACVRFSRGLCRNCHLPVAGRVGWARYCAAHRKAHQIAQGARYRARDREQYNRTQKLRMRTPANRQRSTASKRAWREAHPDLYVAQKVRQALREYRALRGAA